MTKYHYDLSELSNRYEWPGHFITVRVWDDDGRAAEIITNNDGEGMYRWVWDIPGMSGHYAQEKGTLQFRLADTEGGVCKQLARRLNQIVAMAPDLSPSELAARAKEIAQRAGVDVQSRMEMDFHKQL